MKILKLNGLEDWYEGRNKGTLVHVFLCREFIQIIDSRFDVISLFLFYLCITNGLLNTNKMLFFSFH